MNISSFIVTLEQLKENSTLTDSISNYDLLVEGLNDLDEIVEMNDVKSSILLQIKFLIVNYVSMNQKLDGHMVHTVLSGPPGVGKTELGKILSKIWTGLGLLKTVQPTNDCQLSREIKNLKLSGRLKNDVIKKLQSYTKILKQDVENINLADLKYQVNDLKREMIKQGNYEVIGKLDNLSSQLEEIEEEMLNISNSEISEERVHFWVSGNKDSEKLVDKTIDKIPEFIPNRDNQKTAANITVVSREDFVAGYLGQTALKTEKLLQENLGKVIFIDEAYSLVNAENDSFGAEALTVLNRYMSEYGDQLIIIFAGYSDLLEKTIFKMQPGLKRRCSWKFEISGYSPEGLSQIFIKQLAKNGWNVSEDVDLELFFKEHSSRFPHYGGSTSQLAFYSKLAYSEMFFENSVNSNQEISKKHLEKALEMMPKEIENSGFQHMYI